MFIFLVCGTQKSIWICVLCGSLGCGRYVNKHGVQHFEKYEQQKKQLGKGKSHAICMNIQETSVFW